MRAKVKFSPWHRLEMSGATKGTTQLATGARWKVR
jgi:hypothetical protein